MTDYTDGTGMQYHLHIKKGDVGRYVLLPGDPKRVRLIAERLDDAAMIADNREFVTYTGYIDGEKVSVTSTGIGGPSASIAMEELALCGADTFIRVGTCGGIALSVTSGDVVIATGAVRAEGTSREYAPIEFPAVADFDVVYALKKAASELSFPCHLGVVALFTVAARLGARCGAVFFTVANQEREKLGLENPKLHDTSHAIDTAIKAIRILISEDRNRA